MKYQVLSCRLNRARVAATLALLAVLASVFVSPVAAQSTSETHLSTPLVVRDAYNRGDSSLYTNLIVSWRVNHGTDGKAVQNFTIQESADGMTSWSTASTTELSATRYGSYTHYEHRRSGLVPGTTRFYRVQAHFTDSTDSDTMVSARAGTTVSLPTPRWGSSHKIWGYPASDDPDGSLQLWWNSPTNVPSNLWGHRTYDLQAKDVDGNWVDVATGLTSARYLHKGLDPETTVTYRVKATIANATGGWTAVDTGWSGEFQATTDAAPPPVLPAPPPAPDVSVSVTETTVTLTWSAVTYNDANSSGTVWYTIERVADDGTSWQVLSQRQTDLSYEHTGLTAGQDIEYIVYAVVKQKDTDQYVLGNAWYQEVTTSSGGGASGEAGPAFVPDVGAHSSKDQRDEVRLPDTPVASFVIYHDPNAGAAAVNRYNQAIALLSSSGISYFEVSGDVQDEVNALAGVANSVLPRFFLGDPEGSDWGPPQAKVNNGGLKWLRSKLAEPPSPAPLPTVSIAGGPAVDEGTAATFTVTLSAAAPAAGVTLAYSVSEDGEFVEDADEGAKTLAIPGGATSAALSVPTAGDDADEPDGTVTVTLGEGAGYAVGDPASAAVTVRDDDEPAAPAPAVSAFTIYHDPTHSDAAVSRYDTAVGLLDGAGQTYTVRTVTGTDEVDRLAGVSGTVMPRFFLGDPAGSAWGPAQAKVNNGGLRWLRAYLAKLPGLSAGDARVTEAAGVTLDFTVTLAPAVTERVTVAYTTADGTATAGADYTATSGTLTFNAGETAKTISVPVLDDVHDEGEETLTLTLSTAAGARIADGAATGTIVNADPLQQAWLARFGRTVATHVTDAVGERLRRRPEQGSHLTVGGHRLSLGAPAGREEAGTGAGASASGLLHGLAGALGLGPAPSGTGGTWDEVNGRGPDPRLGQSQPLRIDLRHMLLGSSFRLALNGADPGAATPRLTAWGRFAGTAFDGQDGNLALDGDVLTGTVGLDAAQGRWLGGVAVAHSQGDGTYSMPLADGAADRGELEQTLTSLQPYLRYAVTDRLDVWGLLGYGWGELEMARADGGTIETDTTLLLGALGGRGLLLAPEDTGGVQLATRTDAMFTRTSSDAVTGLAGADADAHRVRVILEGSRGVTWADGRSLTPTVELGLRHDWGDAETGFGLEVGGRVQYVDPALGLTVEGAVRGLVAHEDSDYDEWGASGTVRLAPGAGGQGVALTLAPAWGATASGVQDLWARQTTASLASGAGPTQTGRLDAEVGYGLRAFDLGLLTPYAGTSLAGGAARTYRLGTRWQGTHGRATGLTLSLEGTRQEPAGPQPLNQGLRLQATWGF